MAANVLLRQEPDEEEEEEDDGEEGGDDYDKDNDGYSIRKLPIPNPLSGIQEVQSLQGFHFRSVYHLEIKPSQLTLGMAAEG